MIDSYLTIATNHSEEIKIEKSRFIGTAVPCGNREEAEARYADLRKQYYDATHNCFAFRIGLENDVEFRYSDDGEPSGTAGRPIFDAIDSHTLTNLIVVVTRYFGGVKLGTGGLLRAYKEAADTVLRNARKVERLIMQRFRIEHDHEHTAIVMRMLSERNLKPLATEYGAGVTLESEIRAGQFQLFADEVIERSHGKVSINAIGEPR